MGKIYKIEAINGIDEDIYIGSTTKKLLSQRMATHRQNYKNWKLEKTGKCMSFDIFDKYGIDNCKITLLENVNANSKDELHAKEAFYIKNMKCVNKFIPLRTKKEWEEDNKETLKEKRKEYNEIHKEHIAEVKCKWILENLEHVKTKYNETKDKRNATKREKVHCLCGSVFSYGDKSKHLKTIKHLKYLDSINE